MTTGLRYFDYMATTPVDARVAAEMSQCLTAEGDFGNPASAHTYGQKAAFKVETARRDFAEVIGASAEAVVWTSGATESNNLAIKGAAQFYQRQGRHVITVTTEHKAVLDCFAVLEKEGYEVSYLQPSPSGLIDLGQLRDLIRPETILISVMLVNNEIGVIQPIEAIGELAKASGAVFHVDAAQAIGKVVVDVSALPVDLMSFSAHKCYGPKGVGALYVKQQPRVRLNPQIHGGGHERGLRSGTLATHQIVGMATAAAIANAEREQEYQRISQFFERTVERLRALGGVTFHGDLHARVPHNLNFSVDDVDGESLLYALASLCISTTSACSSAGLATSHVLQAIGVPDYLARSSVRFSFGRFTTEAVLKDALDLITREIQRLRAIKP